MYLDVFYNARFQLLLTSMEIKNSGTPTCYVIFPVNCSHSLVVSQLETKRVGNKRGAYNYKKCRMKKKKEILQILKKVSFLNEF